jgi:tetratricopeptide (TPR) repeat protein
LFVVDLRGLVGIFLLNLGVDLPVISRFSRNFVQIFTSKPKFPIKMIHSKWIARQVIMACLLLFLHQSWKAQADEFLFENASVGLKAPDLKLLKEGRVKFLQGQFAEAQELFETISDKNQVYLNYLKGICYSYDPDRRKEAIPLLRALKNREKEISGYNYNLGYALVQNDSISKAVDYFKKELETQHKKGLKDDRFVNEIQLSLQYCYNILDLKDKKGFVRITNLGPPVNTKADEYCPLIPSNGELLIYTYRGPRAKGGKQKLKGSRLRNIDDMELYFEDIFITRKINDTLWSEPEGISELNTNNHDAAVSLNADATQLFIYRNRGEGNGDLYLSELVGSKWTPPVLQHKLNSPEWDGSACFIPNEDKIIFSSERKGGYGGKDLYSAERIKGNIWTNITNLGPKINSKYDEDAPFITSDGRVLFFASNNKNSLGGYDIFRSDFINGQWQAPYNLGPPINTTNDDNYFTVSADGKVAYYSSHKQGGDGGHDIYKVEPGIPGRPVVLLQVEGLVTVNGKPAGADVEIRSRLSNKDLRFHTTANKVSGRFLSNLAAGDEYDLIVSVDPFPPRTIRLSTMNIDSFVVMNVYAEFNTPIYESNQDSKDKTTEEISLTNKDLVKNSFAHAMGDLQIEDLKYTVQIAAFRFSENFNYNGIVGLPKIIRHLDSDGVTRFTMGGFNTYNEALGLLRQVQRSKIGDAFITATYKGERKLLHQLVEEQILR